MSTAAIDYPISLAIEDFAPVLFTTAGVLLLRRVLGGGPAPVAAAVFIGAGGLAKAGAKLIAAADGPDLPWLSEMLFPLLTLGFALLCTAAARTKTGTSPRWLRYLTVGLIAACGLGALLARDSIPMLVSTTVFATITGIYLIGIARDRGDTVAAGLFGVQLLSFYVLGPLASRPDQTVTLQWIEQLCNTAAQAAFLAAAWRLAASEKAVATGR
ncbi:hypothetical protein [Nocardia salmonicida]|uniref:hypothetical protein n=1 Tax=Nocardia salmonicida TaxID=53431 RepID=UPI0007A45515|nr:hypothetical protein [Nocardia salmonicida]